MAKNYGKGIDASGNTFEITSEVIMEYVKRISGIITGISGDGVFFDSMDGMGHWVHIWFMDEEGDWFSRTIGEGEFSLPFEVINMIIAKVEATIPDSIRAFPR